MYLYIRWEQVYNVRQLSTGLLRMIREKKHVISSFPSIQCVCSDTRKDEISGLELWSFDRAFWIPTSKEEEFLLHYSLASNWHPCCPNFVSTPRKMMTRLWNAKFGCHSFPSALLFPWCRLSGGYSSRWCPLFHFHLPSALRIYRTSRNNFIYRVLAAQEPEWCGFYALAFRTGGMWKDRAQPSEPDPSAPP